MVDFLEALNKPVTDIKKPPVKPAGSYQASIIGMPEQRTITTKNGDSNLLAFKFKLVAAGPDVDQEKLADCGDISSWPPFSNDIFIEGDQGLWNLKRFLTDVLHVDPGTEADPKTLAQMVGETPGMSCMVTLAIEPYTDKTTGQPEFANRIRGTASL